MIRIALSLFLIFILGSCGGTVADKLAKAQAFIDSVRLKAEKVCGYQPTAAMVSNVAAQLALNDKDASDVAAVNALAAAICEAIRSPKVEA